MKDWCFCSTRTRPQWFGRKPHATQLTTENTTAGQSLLWCKRSPTAAPVGRHNLYKFPALCSLRCAEWRRRWYGHGGRSLRNLTGPALFERTAKAARPRLRPCAFDYDHCHRSPLRHSDLVNNYSSDESSIMRISMGVIKARRLVVFLLDPTNCNDREISESNGPRRTYGGLACVFSSCSARLIQFLSLP